MYSFFLSFICLFLCSLMSSFVHTECMCLRKTKTSHAGPVEDKTALCFCFKIIIIIIVVFCLFVYYFKDPAQAARMHMHMLILNFVCRTPSLNISYIFFLLLRPKDIDQTAQMHMHAHAALELCWPDVSWASLYVSFIFFYLFIYFFTKILTGPYFTYVYLSQRP